MAEEPLRTTTFTLTRADALAYERHRRRLSPGRAVLLLLWLALAGLVLLLIPDNWSGKLNMPSFWALGAVLVTIQYVLAMLVWAFNDIGRARRRVPRAHEVTLEEFVDRIGVTGSGIPRYVRFSDAGRPLITASHIFLGKPHNLIILPRSAFADEAGFDALSSRLAAAAIAGVVIDPPAATA
ncbi:MAG: hypothetical protein ABIO40_10420 [Devosia sp.]